MSNNFEKLDIEEVDDQLFTAKQTPEFLKKAAAGFEAAPAHFEAGGSEEEANVKRPKLREPIDKVIDVAKKVGMGGAAVLSAAGHLQTNHPLQVIQ